MKVVVVVSNCNVVEPFSAPLGLRFIYGFRSVAGL